MKDNEIVHEAEPPRPETLLHPHVRLFMSRAGQVLLTYFKIGLDMSWQTSWKATSTFQWSELLDMMVGSKPFSVEIIALIVNLN